VAYVGSTFLQTDIGADRLYFVQFADPADERSYDSESTREWDPDGEGFTEKSLHLRSVSIDPEGDHTIKDHGQIVDQDGRAARMISLWQLMIKDAYLCTEAGTLSLLKKLPCNICCLNIQTGIFTGY
jgi:hypothetical protein